MVRDVVRAAALNAARFAVSDLPRGLVRWEDEDQVQAEPGYPEVLLKSVSRVPEGDMLLRNSVNEQRGDLDRRMIQIWIWTVRFQVEQWRTDAFEHVAIMRAGWFLQSTQSALADSDTHSADRTPVVLVEDPGQVLELSTGIRGHTLPVYAFELVFRYHGYHSDPLPLGVIESVALSGTLRDGDTTLPMTIATSIPDPE